VNISYALRPNYLRTIYKEDMRGEMSADDVFGEGFLGEDFFSRVDVPVNVG